ncbi:hypothetical protein [Streptomyces atratus]|uniref:hypothetical protein n=1 Tax=Streptomyces atratus TaxID=1893 RepID=UPI003F53EEAF
MPSSRKAGSSRAGHGAAGTSSTTPGRTCAVIEGSAVGAGDGGLRPKQIARALGLRPAQASAIAWLLKFVAKHSFNAFVVHRIIIGLVIFGLPATNVLGA